MTNHYNLTKLIKKQPDLIKVCYECLKDYNSKKQDYVYYILNDEWIKRKPLNNYNVSSTICNEHLLKNHPSIYYIRNKKVR